MEIEFETTVTDKIQKSNVSVSTDKSLAQLRLALVTFFQQLNKQISQHPASF